MEASIRSRGFWIHSSHRFSLEPVLDVAAELASEVADDCAAKLVIAPKGPASNQRLNIMLSRLWVIYKCCPNIALGVIYISNTNNK